MKTEAYLALGLLLFPTPAPAETAQNVLKELQATYETIETIEGRFHQTYRSARFEPRTAEGKLWIQKPGKMRWDYSVPKGRVLLSDGKELTLYDPADEQALVSPIPENEGLPLPLSFLWGKEKIEDVFTVTVEKEGKSKDEIRLRCIPRKPIPNVVEVELTLKRGKQMLVLASRVKDALGGENELRFSGLRTNSQIPAKRFQFKPPAGTKRVPL
ncbi:MAG: outer membrane lipoprotein carrier protein LolA [Pseudomonadota bacterium]